jgi:Arc/MetJ-type ribon-helix-helix transcriptional regulator
MAIQLSPDQETRVAEALQSGIYQSPAEVIDRALDVLREQEEWLTTNRDAIDAKIRRGIEELDRGEGIPEDELKEHLRQLKSLQE